MTLWALELDGYGTPGIAQQSKAHVEVEMRLTSKSGRATATKKISLPDSLSPAIPRSQEPGVRTRPSSRPHGQRPQRWPAPVNQDQARPARTRPERKAQSQETRTSRREFSLTTLADAYEKAKLVKEQASSETFRLDKLRATRSPLADKVAEGESKVSPEGWRKSAKWGSGPGRVSCKTPLPIPGLPFRDG